MDKKKLAFGKTNFILLAIGMIVVVLGFILMAGPSTTETTFQPDIFSARRIKLAPVICFLGFIFMIYGVVRKPKSEE
jgi:membrane-bound ClpP family serine protease